VLAEIVNGALLLIWGWRSVKNKRAEDAFEKTDHGGWPFAPGIEYFVIRNGSRHIAHPDWLPEPEMRHIVRGT